jgi:hypothetical protein
MYTVRLRGYSPLRDPDSGERSQVSVGSQKENLMLVREFVKALSEPTVVEGARLDHGYDMSHFRHVHRPFYRDGTVDEDGNVVTWLVVWTPLWWKRVSHAWAYVRWTGQYEPGRDCNFKL